MGTYKFIALWIETRSCIGQDKVVTNPFIRGKRCLCVLSDSECNHFRLCRCHWILLHIINRYKVINRYNLKIFSKQPPLNKWITDWITPILLFIEMSQRSYILYMFEFEVYCISSCTYHVTVHCSRGVSPRSRLWLSSLDSLSSGFADSQAKLVSGSHFQWIDQHYKINSTVQNVLRESK